MQRKYKQKNKQQLIFILLILLSIMVISFKFLIKNSQPFGVTVLKVSSNSMVPTFKKGDFIIIKRQTEYAVGDIITYIVREENQTYYVTHRIIEKNEDEYITKGDANNREDLQSVKSDDIKGKVLFHK